MLLLMCCGWLKGSYVVAKVLRVVVRVMWLLMFSGHLLGSCCAVADVLWMVKRELCDC